MVKLVVVDKACNKKCTDMKNFDINYSEEIINDIKEKNAFKTKWNRREKVLDRLVDSITGIVGSIQGTGIESVNLEKIHELKYEE